MGFPLFWDFCALCRKFLSFLFFPWPYSQIQLCTSDCSSNGNVQYYFELEERLCQLSSINGTLILPKLGLRAVWWLNQFWAPGAQNTKNFFSENYFFQYSYDVKMRLSAKCASMESRDFYQIRAECIIILILCPF